MILDRLYNQFKSINNEVYNIHYGGCGVFAKEVYLVLVKLGYKPTLVVITRTVESVEDWVNTNNKTPYIDVTHIVVELDGLYIDNNGVYDSTNKIQHCEGVPVTRILTLEVLQEWLDGIGWNSRFDRTNIPKIEKKLNSCYKTIKRNTRINLALLNLLPTFVANHIN